LTVVMTDKCCRLKLLLTAVTFFLSIDRSILIHFASITQVDFKYECYSYDAINSELDRLRYWLKVLLFYKWFLVVHILFFRWFFKLVCLILCYGQHAQWDSGVVRQSAARGENLNAVFLFPVPCNFIIFYPATFFSAKYILLSTSSFFPPNIF